jgi:transcriptional regulator with XRE-family HTH domain
MAKHRLPAIDVHVGHRIRMRRNALKLSQAALGKAIGVSFQQIQKYEKGANGVNGQRLQALAQALHVPIIFFFENAPGSERIPHCVEPDFIDEFLADKRGFELAWHFTAIADTGARDAILAMTQVFAKTSRRQDERGD